jgi:hypothetical protein
MARKPRSHAEGQRQTWKRTNGQPEMKTQESSSREKDQRQWGSAAQACMSRLRALLFLLGHVMSGRESLVPPTQGGTGCRCHTCFPARVSC